MKSITVSLFGILGINYAIPATIDELARNAVPVPEGASEEDSAALLAKGHERVLHSANEHLKQKSLAKVRATAIELIGEKYDIKPKITVGKKEVAPVLYEKGEKDTDGKVIDKEGVIKEYVSVDGKNTKYKKDVKNLSHEGDSEFFKRFKEEKGLTDESPEILELLQAAADKTPFSAKLQRVRGSVASKPIGKGHIKLAQGIVDAGNHVGAAERIGKEIGKTIDVSDPSTRVMNLALAMQTKAKQAKELADKELAEYAKGADSDIPPPVPTDADAPPTVVIEA